MKRVLILSDYFTPCIPGATAGKRIAAFSKYLPENGWQPIVVTRQCTCRPEDNSRINNVIVRPQETQWLDQLPKETVPIVIRIECTPIKAYRAWIKCASRAGTLPQKEDLPFYGLFHTCYHWNEDVCSRSDRFGKIYGLLQKTIAATMKLMPDATDWAMRAQYVGESIHQLLPLTAIVSSAPSASNHLVAAKLGKKLDVPFLFDFRDVIHRGWSDGFLGNASSYSQMRRVQSASRKAKHCFFVTHGELQRGLKQTKCSESSIIPNGYDSDEMSSVLDLNMRRPTDCFTLRLLGTVYPQQGLDVFLSGFRKFLSSKVEKPQIRFEYFGPTEATIRLSAADAGIGDFCGINSSVPYRKSLELTVTADLLVLLTTKNQSGIPGAKFYEYLGSQRPILAVGGDSEVSQELERLRAGKEAHSSEEVCEFLSESYTRWKQGDSLTGCTDPKLLLPFTRRAGVELLADKLASSCKDKSSNT